jgi:hypothetical protein
MNDASPQMIADVATMKAEIKHLTDMLHDQKRVLDKQDRILEELVAMANKGKGSLWMLLAIGGFIGAVVSNISTIIGFFKH